jgi:thymidine phosphorylase
MSKTEKLNIGNIIEINEIKSILSKDKNLLDIFNMVLKIANKSLNMEEIEDIIEDTETEKSISIYTDSSSEDDSDSDILSPTPQGYKD